MSKKRSRLENKAKASHLAPPILSVVTNNVVKASSNASTSDRLGGIEDIAQNDSSGVPFIIVDNVCVKTRKQLQVALTKHEKKSIKRVQKQCSILPWLEHTTPATKAEPMTVSEKESKAEVDFLEDLELLKLDMQRAKEINAATQPSGSATPIAHAPSDEDLVVKLSRIDEIRIQLEQLREQQECDTSAPISMSDHLRIRRQATFDIERTDPIETSPSSISLDSQPAASTQQRLVRATTISQMPPLNSRPTIQKMYSATCLCKKSTSSVVLGSNKSNRLDPVSAEKSPGLPIINQIGDLLLKLPNQQKEKPALNNGHYSYLVTISPNLGRASCNVEPLPFPTTRSLTMRNATCCAPERMKSESPIDIAAAKPGLKPKSRTFLNIPRLFKKMK